MTAYIQASLELVVGASLDALFVPSPAERQSITEPVLATLTDPAGGPKQVHFL
jgi:hypothetical protein